MSISMDPPAPRSKREPDIVGDRLVDLAAIAPDDLDVYGPDGGSAKALADARQTG